MSSPRQLETGQLAIGRTIGTPAAGCLPGWMQESMDAQSGFLPPAPNSASLTYYAGATWFSRSSRRFNPEGAAESD
jgi:hypothetical protein